MFDGYDEISKAKINQISICIQRFSHRYSRNSFIISSRQIDNIYGWDDYLVYSLCSLDFEDAVKLIWNLDYAVDMKKRFIDELRKGIYMKYKSIASVPLLLSIMYMTYVDNAMIPESLGDFYERAFDTMMYAHDRRQKVGFEREFDSGLKYTNFKDVFRAFCFRSYFNDEYSFSEDSLIINIRWVKEAAKTTFDAKAYKDDLVNITCMIIKDGPEYVFIHRSFQEYFAANFVSKMLEDEQREFCLEFINSIDIEPLNEASSFSVLGRVTNKAIDFLNMLYQIDPKTFEYVVLKPLFEKIYKVFIEREMDLIETASKFFCVVTVNYDDELSDNILYYYLHEEEENWLTEKEFVVLCYFYKNAFWDVNSFARAEFEKKLSDDMSIEFYDKLYEYDESDWDEEDCKYRPVELIRTLSSPSLIEPRLIICELMSLFDFAITRNEILNKTSKEKTQFMDRVNNPKYYAR